MKIMMRVISIIVWVLLAVSLNACTWREEATVMPSPLPTTGDSQASDFKPKEAATQTAIELDSVAIWPWDDDVPLKIVDVQPPPAGGSFLELPGPKRRPVRPYLEPFASSGGLAARLVQADGQVEPLIFLVNEAGSSLLPIFAPPLALMVREDGHIWVLTEDELSTYDTNGHQLFSLELVGQTLVDSLNNSVWVVEHNRAWFVEPNGQISQEYAWEGGINSGRGENGMLCALGKGKSPQIRCLTPDGSKTLMAWPLSARPMERLLTVNEQEFLTIAGSSLRRYDATGLIDEVMMQSAGFTDKNEVFASGREGDWINLWLTDSTQRIALPSGLPEWGAFKVVAVKDGASLVYGLDMAAWYDGSQLKERVVVDEEHYRSQVFPHLWSLSSTRSVTADGTIILSVSGPKGVGLIELRWEKGPLHPPDSARTDKRPESVAVQKTGVVITREPEADNKPPTPSGQSATLEAVNEPDLSHSVGPFTITSHVILSTYESFPDVPFSQWEPIHSQELLKTNGFGETSDDWRQATQHSSGLIRETAYYVLTFNREALTRPPAQEDELLFRQGLDDPDASVQALSAYGLYLLGDRSVLPTIERISQHEYVDFAALRAAGILGQLGQPEGFATLLRGMNDTDSAGTRIGVINNAWHFVALHNDEYAPSKKIDIWHLYSQALQDEHESVRYVARAQLSEINTPEALELLEAFPE